MTVAHLHKQPPPVCTGSGTVATDVNFSTVTKLGMCGICGCWVKAEASLLKEGYICTTHPYFDPQTRTAHADPAPPPWSILEAARRVLNLESNATCDYPRQEDIGAFYRALGDLRVLVDAAESEGDPALAESEAP